MIVTPFTHEPTHKSVWDVRTNGNVFPVLTVWDVHTSGYIFPGLTVWEVHMNGNVFPGLTVWDVHKNGNVFLGLTVCDIHTNENVFLGFTMWDVHTYGNDFLGLPCGMYIPTEMIGFRCLARSHMAPACSLEGLSLTISRSCGKDPPIAHTHLATVPNVIAESG